MFLWQLDKVHKPVERSCCPGKQIRSPISCSSWPWPHDIRKVWSSPQVALELRNSLIPFPGFPWNFDFCHVFPKLLLIIRLLCYQCLVLSPGMLPLSSGILLSLFQCCLWHQNSLLSCFRGCPWDLIFSDAEFLDKSLKIFPPCCSQSPLQLCLKISVSSNSRNLLQFLQFSYVYCNGQRRKTW